MDWKNNFLNLYIISFVMFKLIFENNEKHQPLKYMNVYYT